MARFSEVFPVNWRTNPSNPRPRVGMRGGVYKFSAGRARVACSNRGIGIRRGTEKRIGSLLARPCITRIRRSVQFASWSRGRGIVCGRGRIGGRRNRPASFVAGTRALERIRVSRGNATRPDSPFRAACFDTPPIHHLRFVAAATGQINFVERIAAHGLRALSARTRWKFNNFGKFFENADRGWLDSCRRGRKEKGNLFILFDNLDSNRVKSSMK